MRQSHHHGLLLVSGLLTLHGCGDNTRARSTADAGAVDATAVDAEVSPPIDAAVTDAVPRPDAVPAKSCLAPLTLAPGGSHLGDTTTHQNRGEASCSPGTSSSRDAVYRVPLPSTPTDLIARVLVDESVAQPFDVVLAVQRDCGVEESEAACSDFGFSEAVEALALTDEAFVHIDGTPQFGGSAAGAYQLDVRTRAIVGQDETCDEDLRASRCAAGLRCVSTSCIADSAGLACSEAASLPVGASVSARSHPFEPDFLQGSCAFDAQAGAPETLFRFTLAQSSNISVTTDFPGTSFDTVLYLLDSCGGTELACADDIDAAGDNFTSSLQASALAAGDYIVVVDGSSAAAPTGSLVIRLDVTPI